VSTVAKARASRHSRRPSWPSLTAMPNWWRRSPKSRAIRARSRRPVFT